MRSSVAFALISLNVACWTTIAAADDLAQGATDKGGRIVANAPRYVDTTHGVSTAPEHAGAAMIANLVGSSAGAAASAVQPPAMNATANIMLARGERYPGSYRAAAVSAAGVTAAFSPSAGIAASRTGIDRAGAVAGFGGVQAVTVRPMGAGAAAANFTAVGVRPDAAAQPNGVVAVGGVLSAAAAANWKTGLTQGIESTSVRATAALADVPSGGALTPRPGGVAPRTVNVRNRLTSIGGSTRPIRNKH